MQLACSNPSAMPGTAARGTWVIQAHPGWGLAGADPVEVKLGRGVWEAGEAPKRLLPGDGVLGRGGLFELGE